LGRAAAQDARQDLDGEQRPAHRHGPGFDDREQGCALEGEQPQARGIDEERELRDAARGRADGDEEHHEPDDDGDALEEIGHDVREQAARNRVRDHENRCRRDRNVYVQRRRRAQHLAERPNLRRRPEDRRRDHEDHGEPLDTHAIALAKEIAERRVVAPPERRRNDEADDNET
jgi:hypothetical protein